jgi:hypothetical protein
MQVLTPKTLGLKSEWTIYSYWFDYDRSKSTFDEKVWQFAIRNSKTGETRAILAADVETRMLQQCRPPQ